MGNKKGSEVMFGDFCVFRICDLLCNQVDSW